MAWMASSLNSVFPLRRARAERLARMMTMADIGGVSALQPTASDAFRMSVTSMWAGVWVIAMGGRAERTAT